MALSLWLGFFAATILIAISPGPGAVASMSTGMRYGYWAAFRVILGLQAALLLQLLVVALGLGALLASSEVAFEGVKLIGAAYLIWLGIQKWRAEAEEVNERCFSMVPNGLFFQGLLVNLSNPKAIVFIAALVPQFIDPTSAQFFVIALTMFIVDVLVMSAYALLATRLRHWLHDLSALKVLNRFFGGVFVSAGVMLAVSGRS
ncbi:MAG: LysE family transporter [Betaproteobacteria bacterium]